MIVSKICFAFLLFYGLVQGDDYDNMHWNEDLGNCDCETEIYEAGVEHGIIKSPHYPRFDPCIGTCVYRILPHPEKSVVLYTSWFELSDSVSLQIYSLIETKNGTMLIPHAKIVRNKRYYYYNSNEESFPGFVSAINAGFEIQYVVSSDFYYTNFKMSFDRNYEYPELCGFPLVTVGVEETVVQKSHVFRSASGCVYKLQPENYSDGDEIIINIEESEENEVSVRALNEYGRMRASKSYLKATIMKDAKELQLLSHKTSRTNGVYLLTRITARLVKRSCECGDTLFNVHHLQQPMISIRNPGYPELYCPNRKCTYKVRVVDEQTDSNELGILQINMKALFSFRDTFKLTTDVKDLIEVSPYKDEPSFLQEHFVVKQQSLELKFESSDEYTERYFEVNITHRMIAPECVCNFYKDKQLSDLTTLEISFPNTCNFIYCNFNVKGDTWSKRFLVDFMIRGAAQGDHVAIRDKGHDEMYDYTSLGKVNRYEADTDTSFSYYRENVTTTEMTVLSLNYTILDKTGSCNGVAQYIMVDREAIITSPGYPKSYESNQRCEFIVSVPERSRMVLSLDEISLENFHDYVTIYEGNSTDGQKIGTYTAQVSHKVFNVSSTTILIVFFTDQGTSDRGFHITVTARSLDDDQNEGHLFAYIFLGIGSLVILGIILIVYYYESRLGVHRLQQFVRNFRRNDRQPEAAEQTNEGNTEPVPHIAGTAPATQQPQQANLMNLFD